MAADLEERDESAVDLPKSSRRRHPDRHRCELLESFGRYVGSFW